jgi:hypothetical protein
MFCFADTWEEGNENEKSQLFRLKEFNSRPISSFKKQIYEIPPIGIQIYSKYPSVKQPPKNINYDKVNFE